MKIAMISTAFVPVPPKGYGGTELVVSELVDGLVRRGHEVTLFATGDSRTDAELRALYDEAVWPPHPLVDANHVGWAMHEALNEGFDLIHAHSAEALALGRFRPSVPLSYTIHHDRDPHFSEYYQHFPDVQYIAISASQARREVPLRRVRVIHHGLDAAKYEWSASAPAEYVAFIGRFAEYKGPHTAMDVAEEAGLEIVVGGETHEEAREWSEREVAPRLERDHVRYLGPVDFGEKVPLLRDARALLAPITWNEPFGLILIEAMLSGCPVLAYEHGSVPELIEPGLTGYIAEDAAEMVRLVRPGGPLDDFDRERCRRRAAERFGAERMVRDHEALYAEMLGRGGSAQRFRAA